MRSAELSKITTDRRIGWLSALACALIGCWILAVSMRLGPGIGGDATIYITTARNLIDGRGLGLYNPLGEFRLLPYFPPFYPLTLALAGSMGLEIVVFAQVLNLICFGLTIFIISGCLSAVLRNWLPGMLAGLLLAGSPILIPAYSWAMSEPLCFLLMVAGFLFLARWYEGPKTLWLVLSAALCGLSFLTRYSSAACIMTACLILFFFQKRSFGRRFLDTLLYGLVAVIPMGIWMIVDLRMTQTVASRSLLQGSGLFGESLRFFGQLKSIFALWFLPDSWLQNDRFSVVAPPLLTLTVFLFALICLVRVIAAARKEPDQQSAGREALLRIFSIFFFAYILIVWLVSVLTFPPITIGARMLIPAYLSLIVLAVVHATPVLNPDKMKQAGSGNRLRRPAVNIAFALLFAFAGFQGLRGSRIARQNAIDGLGYNALAWQESQTVRYLREELPQDQLLITNEETALLFLLNRTSWPMKEIYANQPDTLFYAYRDSVADTTDKGRLAFQDGRALLVVFDTFEDQMRDIYGEDTEARIRALLNGLDIVFDGDDGAIYRVAAE